MLHRDCFTFCIRFWVIINHLLKVWDGGWVYTHQSALDALFLASVILFLKKRPEVYLGAQKKMT